MRVWPSRRWVWPSRRSVSSRHTSERTQAMSPTMSARESDSDSDDGADDVEYLSLGHGSFLAGCKYTASMSRTMVSARPLGGRWSRLPARLQLAAASRATRGVQAGR